MLDVIKLKQTFMSRPCISRIVRSLKHVHVITNNDTNSTCRVLIFNYRSIQLTGLDSAEKAKGIPSMRNTFSVENSMDGKNQGHGEYLQDKYIHKPVLCELTLLKHNEFFH